MNIYDTTTLLGVMRELDQFDPFLLNLFFPEVATFDTKAIAFDKLSDDMTLAPFVSPMVAGKANKAAGGEVHSFEPGYLKPKDVVDPERVLKRRPGEAIGGNLSPAARRDAVIADILDAHRRNILLRLEWMAAQALLTGKVTVEGEDYPTHEVDFQRDAGNTIVNAGGDVWTDLNNAEPTDQIESWGEQAEAPLTHLVFNRTAWRNFSKFQSVKDLLDTRRGSNTTLETGPDNGSLASYKGTLGADIECWVYSGYYRDASGNKQLFIPENKVIAGSRAVQGVRAFGAILDPQAGYQAMEMFPKNWINEDPAAEFVMTQSGPLMVPARPNASLGITVA